MKNAIELLFNLQVLEMGPNPESAPQADEILRLRQKIPAPILAHYDRLRSRDKKGVAVVRNSVCCECHMRLASGVYATLLRRDDVMICGTCGRYLHIPREVAAMVEEPPPQKPPTRKRRQKTAASGTEP